MRTDKVFVEMRKQINKFTLIYRLNRSTGVPEFVLQSKAAGKHFAAHSRFNLLADDGSILSSELISQNVAKFIMENFEKRGDTASFDIYKSDLESMVLSNRKPPQVRPDDVRHTLTSTEHSFTATGSKLLHHWPIFEKFKETGFGSIIRATMTLHQVCSSHCHYCSTIARNRKDSITLQEAKAFVESLYDEQADFNRVQFPEYNRKYMEAAGSDIRLRGLILSGGGQPNLWPHFEEFVRWLSKRDIDLGLITNGFPKNIPEDVYQHFKWIRVSITPEDASPHYPSRRFDLQYLPSTIIRNTDVTVGYSYVYGPWTDDGILERIVNATEDNGFRYTRLLTDCNLTRGAQLRAHQSLAEKLFNLGFIDSVGNPLKGIFHQLKFHGNEDEANALWEDGQCYLQTYNVFWDTTGHEENGVSHCYACDSITVLAEEQTDLVVTASERRFNHGKWGLVTNDKVENLFKEPVKPYFDPREVCSSCLFMKNNNTVKSLSRRVNYDNIGMSNKTEHINFP